MPFVRELGFDVVDHGAAAYDASDDYPSYIAAAARAVAQGKGDARAIVFGRSGQGEAMVANRFPGVRACLYYGGPLDLVRLTREHNDANVLSLGAGFLSEEEAREALHLWLTTSFSEAERHVRRIEQMESVSTGV